MGNEAHAPRLALPLHVHRPILRAMAEITDLLAQARGGDESAPGPLMPVVYEHPRELALSTHVTETARACTRMQWKCSVVGDHLDTTRQSLRPDEPCVEFRRRKLKQP